MDQGLSTKARGVWRCSSFNSLWHAPVVLAAWERDSNEVRPHSALGGRAPGSMRVPLCSPASRPLRAGSAGGLLPASTQTARGGLVVVAGTKKRGSTGVRNIGTVGVGMNQDAISSKGRGVGVPIDICHGKENCSVHCRKPEAYPPTLALVPAAEGQMVERSR